jgi:hypothetical protein
MNTTQPQGQNTGNTTQPQGQNTGNTAQPQGQTTTIDMSVIIEECRGTDIQTGGSIYLKGYQHIRFPTANLDEVYTAPHNKIASLEGKKILDVFGLVMEMEQYKLNLVFDGYMQPTTNTQPTTNIPSCININPIIHVKGVPHKLTIGSIMIIGCYTGFIEKVSEMIKLSTDAGSEYTDINSLRDIVYPNNWSVKSMLDNIVSDPLLVFCVGIMVTVFCSLFTHIKVDGTWSKEEKVLLIGGGVTVLATLYAVYKQCCGQRKYKTDDETPLLHNIDHIV